MGLLFFSLFNSILGLSVLFPVLGPLGRSLGLGDFEIGLLSTGYALSQLVLSPFWGRLSETRGRKPILLVGVAGFGVGFGLFGVLATLGQSGALSHGALVASLVASRVAGGALSSATIPTAQAYAADISDRENRSAAMAVVGAAFGLAVIFGPAIGAAVSHFFGLLAPVWLSVGMSVVNTVLVLVMLPEPARHTTRGAPPELLPVAKKVATLLAVAFAATLSSVAMEQTIAFAFQDRLHLRAEETPAWVGSALVVYGVIAVIAQGFLVRRFKLAPRTLMLAGLPLALVGMALLAVVSSFPLMVVALSLQGLGQGLVLPGVTSALSLGVGDDEQGAVAGVNSAAQGLGRLFGPVVGSRLYELSGALPYAFSSGLLALVLVFVLASPSLAGTDEAPSAR